MTWRPLLSWWVRELTGMLPASLRHSARPRTPALVFDLSEARIEALHEVNGHAERLGGMPRAAATRSDAAGERELLKTRLRRLHPGQTRIIVRLPPSQVHRTIVDLPLVAEESLVQALSYQVELETPFRRDKVYFSYRIQERNTRAGRLSVQLDVAPREVVEEALMLVEDWGPRAAPVDQQHVDDSARLFRFLPARYRGARGMHLNGGLAILNGLLLVLLVAGTVWRQHVFLNTLRAELASAKAAAERSAGLRRRVELLESETRFLAQERSKKPAAVEVLERLSALLPDSTWLYRLDINDRTVNLYGVSDSAASLIEPLEKSGMLHDIRFDAPVTQDRVSGVERFQLTAELNGTPIPKAEPGP